MPANTSRFNRFFWLLPASLLFISGAFAQVGELSPDDFRQLGRQIYANECASRPACLTSWNAGEDFPSLGIGHFIWYREGQQEVFEQTFPALLHYLQRAGVSLPAWLTAGQAAAAPWQSREQFLAAQDSARMRELRQLLAATQDLQARFIAERFFASSEAILAAADPAERETLTKHLYTLAANDAPYGLYALIDYVHFKGTGLHSSERYADQGWGLLQVLQAMPADGSELTDFVDAAAAVLQRRVQNAPPERNEQRWLAGWTHRLQTYLPESETFTAHD